MPDTGKLEQPSKIERAVVREAAAILRAHDRAFLAGLLERYLREEGS